MKKAKQHIPKRYFPFPSFETFKKHMDKLKKFDKDVQRIDNAFKILDKDFCGFNFGWVHTHIFQLITELMHDRYDYIGYYIYDLDWGKSWKKGSVTDKSGKDIPLKTFKQLYNHIKSGV